MSASDRDVTALPLVYVVTLRKKHDGFGTARKDTLYEAAFKNGHSPDEAQYRAYRMLKRDHPNENPMAWETAGVR